MKLLVASILLLGCESSAPKPTTAAAPSTEPSVMVTRADVRVLGKSIGIAPAQLLADRAPVVGALRAGKVAATDQLVVAYTPDASAAAVLAAWRATHEAGFDHVDLGSLVDGKLQAVCAHQSFAPPPADGESVHLSVRVEPERRVLGISRVQEFQTEDAPYAAYQAHLHEHKQSAFFADRQDVEIAALPETTGAQLGDAIAPICEEFSDVVPLTIAELSAWKPADLDTHGASGFDNTNVYGGLRGHAVPTVTLGEPAIAGTVDKSAVVAALAQNHDKLQYCYEKELLANPELAGSVAAKLTIKKDGTAPDASASGVDPQVSGCMADVLRGIEFPKGGTATVSVTFEAKIAR